MIVLLPVFLIAIIGILISDWGPVFIVRIVLEKITSLLGCISSKHDDRQDADEKSFRRIRTVSSSGCHYALQD